MKNVFIACLCILMLNSCKKKAEEQSTKPDEIAKVEYASFGKEINANDAIDASSIVTHFKTMKSGDSIDSKITAKVNSVCQAKGCWMRLGLADGEEVFVKFKDYGFFVPMNIAGDEVVVNGKAFVSEVSVEEQRHYAEDAGKTPEEIAQITEVKRTYSFLADGVLVKQE